MFKLGFDPAEALDGAEACKILFILFPGKKKIQAELEDSNIELEAQRAKVLELEKKQKSFDKVVAEERAVAERNAADRDAAEREAREKETRVLSLTRELDEASEKVTNKQYSFTPTCISVIESYMRRSIVLANLKFLLCELSGIQHWTPPLNISCFSDSDSCWISLI